MADPKADYDLIIAGGGLAGSALGIVMARAGYRVLVVERELKFRDRIRGEVVLAWGSREAKRLGLYDDLTASGALEAPFWSYFVSGAFARVPSDATAFAHRSKPMLVNVAAFYQGAADREVRRSWVTEFARTLQPGDQSAYVGFLTDDGEKRIRGAYPGATWDRLTKIKATYDPGNLFRVNQNIPPRA